MWITERTNSKGTRYVYRERFKDEQTGESIILSVTLNSNSRHTQKVAADMLREKFQKSQDRGKQMKARRLQSLTLETVFQEWEQIAGVSIKPQTQQLHQAYIARILKGLPPGILLKDFTPSLAKKVIADCYKCGCCFEYSKALLGVIKCAMRHAKEAGYIQDVTDYTGIKLKRRPATPEELERKNNKFLDHDELRSCLDQLKKLNYRVALAMEFISRTGLRCGELLALRWCDVDLEKKELSVTGTILATVKNGEDVQRGTPKNKFSYRTISLDNRAVEILDEFRKMNLKMEKWGVTNTGRSCHYRDRGYVFTNDSGYPICSRTISRYLKQVSIPGKHITSHIFRHTHISLLLEQKLPLKAVMQRVGHHDPKTTLEVYAHVTQSMKEQVRDCLNKLVI